MKSVLHAVLVGSAALLAGCQGTQRKADAPQLFDGMETLHRPVTTSSAAAQRYFDQGLIWSYAFNHDEAIRSFGEAARLDPDCAMAWWGVALCNGPHINNPVVPPERAEAAWSALQEAQRKAARASAVEQALIHALAARYSESPTAERGPLDHAYATAMKDVWKSYPRDADVGTLYAEALMDLQPWDLWTPSGEPKGQTNEIVATLEAVLRLNSNHIGADHLYIHALEASPYPERADASATRLRTAVPIAGHLVHMPAHIDVQVGRWALAADQNVRASAADQRYRTLAPRQGFYNVYMAHNRHFLAFASMMEGRSAVALKAAREMIAGVPAEFMQANPALVDPLASIVTEVLMRFGRWQDVLQQPQPDARLPIATCIWHYARGVAHAALNDVAAADRERELFKAAVKKVPADATTGLNPASMALGIAANVLDGEIAFRRGEIDSALASLREAVRIEDQLRYMEPPEWILPARHALGAVLVSAGRFEEAEAVYRDDLRVWPENGWSLFGLAKCLRARGQLDEAAAVQRRFEKVWARADVKIESSCFCTRNSGASVVR